VIAVIDGLEIGYDDVGTGLPVLFVHAFPLNRTMWAPQVSALVERCRCVAADLRGFGESSTRPPYSMEQYADDLAHLLDQLRIDQVVMVGCSMGGYVSFAFWRRHRDRVRAMVLADTRAGPDSEETLTRRRQLIEVARTEGSTTVANLQIASLIGKTAREKQPDTFDAVHRMMAQARAEGIVGALEAMMLRPDSTSTLATISVPTLIVVGDEDVPTPVKESRVMHDKIPGSRLEIIAQTGHLAGVERPAAFNHLLTEFVGALTYS
jgi:pimeloyl-ACP methyl ester carboxylesterase